MTADNLINLLDALTETSIYVIEEDSHRLLYFRKPGGRRQDLAAHATRCGLSTVTIAH